MVGRGVGGAFRLGGFRFGEDLDLRSANHGLVKSDGGRRQKRVGTYIELPPLNVIARVLIRDDNDQFGNLAAHHPLVELRHDLLDVGAHLIVGRDQHIEAILFDCRKVLSRVDAPLEQDGVDRILELWQCAVAAVSRERLLAEVCAEALTNSATNLALPLSDNLCTLDLSFSGGAEVILF